ncbi:hypothetical protein U1707_15775 [Sphingomonas sp. PB2P12]|uniref:hypothetical protein n=1 Tax=Sphingomonas sandaracina TaxID=3096157 RepID=UPI002FC6369E
MITRRNMTASPSTAAVRFDRRITRDGGGVVPVLVDASPAKRGQPVSPWKIARS